MALIACMYVLQATVNPQKCKKPSSELGSTWGENKTASRKKTIDEDNSE